MTIRICRRYECYCIMSSCCAEWTLRGLEVSACDEKHSVLVLLLECEATRGLTVLVCLVLCDLSWVGWLHYGCDRLILCFSVVCSVFGVHSVHHAGADGVRNSDELKFQE